QVFQILLAVLQLSAGIAQTVEVAKVHRNSQLASTMVTSTTQGAATLACDITITVILSQILWKSRTGVRRTDSVLDKMIIYAVNRGAMTSLLALLQLVFFVTMPGTFVLSVDLLSEVETGFTTSNHQNSSLFILPSFHVYVISVCSMFVTGLLASRETLRAELRGSDGIINSYPLSIMQSNSTPNTLANESMAHGANVSTSVMKWEEDKPVDDNNLENLDVKKMSMRSVQSLRLQD
ncbi:hypothetical protein B0H11DRAFT_2377096, partial [Mycena galericulata]